MDGANSVAEWSAITSQLRWVLSRDLKDMGEQVTCEIETSPHGTGFEVWMHWPNLRTRKKGGVAGTENAGAKW